MRGRSFLLDAAVCLCWLGSFGWVRAQVGFWPAAVACFLFWRWVRNAGWRTIPWHWFDPEPGTFDDMRM